MSDPTPYPNPYAYCPTCTRALTNRSSILTHNDQCALDGERSYHRAVNLTPMTTTAVRMHQGSGAKGRRDLG